MADVKYGVIHEVGEFQDVKPLTEEENKIVNEADKASKETNKDNQ